MAGFPKLASLLVVALTLANTVSAGLPPVIIVPGLTASVLQDKHPALLNWESGTSCTLPVKSWATLWRSATMATLEWKCFFYLMTVLFNPATKK